MENCEREITNRGNDWKKYLPGRNIIDATVCNIVENIWLFWITMHRKIWIYKVTK